MAFIPVPNTLEVELVQSMDNQIIENTLYFEFETTPSESDAGGLATALIAWWDDQFSTELSADLLLLRVVVTDLSADDSFSLTFNATPTPAGKVSDGSVPNNCAICISFRTAGRGRSARGRNYVAGLPNGFVAANRVVATVTDSLVAAYNALVSLAGGAGAVWVVVSRFTNHLPRVSGATFPITTAVLVDNVLDSQRRRLPGRGT